MEGNQRIAIFPASFDPVTRGHIDMIDRLAELKLLDKLILAVGVNPEKTTLFTAEERLDMLRRVASNYPFVTVDHYTGLTAHYARECGAKVIIRGLRAFTDFEYEFQMALMNRQQAPDVDTLFMMSDMRYAHLRSSLVKQVALLGGDLTELVPPFVAEMLYEKLGNSGSGMG